MCGPNTPILSGIRKSDPVFRKAGLTDKQEELSAKTDPFSTAVKKKDPGVRMVHDLNHPDSLAPVTAPGPISNSMTISGSSGGYSRAGNRLAIRSQA